ncbi:MAG TPA: malonyl-ACP O-methyltransferase BioC [Thiobacillus sp.]|jgi:malonyl-CoA O-methyltransferase|nr:malonyl-ACP O-methyltransferase BioC [Gammaproteobacteria bacterium]OYZ29572.1 MAG: malonyl-[acyl-carrier protein] O-methyltransferase BioC [Hydrogenophilales bacterium 16-64-40]OZA35469.1 MAG: malonyl-[acyl-carrier protein] O-methyltransferase BioC [Hydrogenophilales bacterium 17-64-65]HQS82947.1 malonyl-ACP O-methyltransferase BioC [Thiobacillus sp.]HQT34418.1 malonyl-ACP O-methyltransferase BioC [Thiobacillus sp.]
MTESQVPPAHSDAPEALELAEIRRAFDQAAASYDAHAVLQRVVCDRLLERLDFMTLQPERVLDVGCGTGYGLAHLHTRYAEAGFCALDVAPAMLAAARARLPQPGWAQRALTKLSSRSSVMPLWLCADMERLPLASNSVNLVWSSLALQWAQDLEATLKGLYRVLAPGGLLMFATFGPDTLKELRTAFAAVDDAPHVNRFTDLHDIGDMLVNAGFASPVMEMEMLTLTYTDLKSLMRDLKGIGAHNAAAARRRGLLGKTAWARLEKAYETHRLEGRLPATFEVIYGHAWVGDKTQREDGRQVIQFNIGERRRKLGLA